MNRYLTQFPLTFEKKVVNVYGKIAIGGTGAPTISAVNSKGIVSVTRNSAGLYTFVFGTQAGKLDTYVKLLGMKAVFYSPSAAPAAPIGYVKAINIATVGTSSIQVGFVDYAGAAADPANGETLYIEFTLGDSTAP